MADDPRTNHERMLAGDPYVADDPELGARMRRAAALSAEFAELWPRDREAGRAVLQTLLGGLGEGTVVRPPIYVDYGEQLTVGAHGFVNFGLVALDVAPITIGDNCQIGPNVQLLAASHPTEPGPRRDKLEMAAPIVIGENVWLGGGAIVLAGITIGDNAVIGAGAVVTKDIPAGVVAVGNPARVIREV
jgi:maltose O-acetyltransferase